MSSFTQLTHRCRDRLYRLAVRITGSSARGEDVVQDVLMSAWQDRDRLLSLDDPRAWLLRMTHNRAIDSLRSGRARSDREAVAALPERSDLTPLRLVETRDEIDRVGRLMAKLPEVQRSVLQLREIEGLSYAEISSATGLSAAQVKVHLHRGRTQLRSWLLAASKEAS